MREAGLGQLAPPRPARSAVTVWGGRIVGGAAAFAAGSVLGSADDPLQLALLPVLGAVAIAAAVARLRWCLVTVLFLLVTYLPDTLAGPSLAHALTAVVVAGALVGVALGRERFASPRELLPLGALLLACGAAALGAGDRGVAAEEALDLVGYLVMVAMLLVLVDTPSWLRRALWAVVAGVGLLALLAIVQQLTKTYGSSYGGLAGVIRTSETIRSAGPLQANTFGQVLATAAVLAFYLSQIESRRGRQALAGAISLACVVALGYTQSRAALIALLLAAVAVGALRGVRLRVLAATVCAVVVLGSVVLPENLQTRIGALSEVVSADAASFKDTALRGRTSVNLAGLEMWADHPLVGVGPDNFELNYQVYSQAIGIDPRPQRRGAHNLYLEWLAETGLLGALAFLGVVALALTGAWRARRQLEGREALLGEGLLVALGAFLACALTLHTSYARYQWIFLGLGLAAGCLARRPAR